MNEKKIKTILCAGDIVGYYTRPNETIMWFRDKKVISVLGNHDKAIFDKNAAKNFNMHAKQACSWTRRNISDENLNYLLNLKPDFEGIVNGKKIYIIHGSPINAYDDYLYEKDIDEYYLNKYFNKHFDLIISGQTHMPFIKKIQNTLLINPGSVGQPRSGDNRTCFAIYNEKTNESEIIHLKYDFSEIVKETREELSEYLAQRLIEGI